MQELIWLIEPIQVLARGGGFAEATQTKGFLSLAILAALLIPCSIIAFGLGVDGWRETPLARYFGLGDDPDADWATRARDRDGDGTLDF